MKRRTPTMKIKRKGDPGQHHNHSNRKHFAAGVVTGAAGLSALGVGAAALTLHHAGKHDIRFFDPR